MKQKFKRGNLVKVLYGQHGWINGKAVDMSTEEVGREAIIIGSYADQYGGSDTKNYTIMFCDTGQETSWKSEKDMEYIEEGGEYLIKEIEIKKKKIKELNTNLNYIVNNWDLIKNEISSDTILYLFDKIGYKSNYIYSGEYYELFTDWCVLFPMFEVMFQEYKLNKKLNNKGQSKYILEFFNEIKAIKNNERSKTNQQG